MSWCLSVLVQDDEGSHDPILQSFRKSKAGKALFAFAEGVYARRVGEREILSELNALRSVVVDAVKVANFTEDGVRELTSARPLEI